VMVSSAARAASTKSRGLRKSSWGIVNVPIRALLAQRMRICVIISQQAQLNAALLPNSTGC
jgi:hypothetical protein